MFLGAVEEAKKEGGTVVFGGKVMTPELSSDTFLLLRHKLGSVQMGEGSPTAVFLFSILFVRGKSVFW